MYYRLSPKLFAALSCISVFTLHSHLGASSMSAWEQLEQLEAEGQHLKWTTFNITWQGASISNKNHLSLGFQGFSLIHYMWTAA